MRNTSDVWTGKAENYDRARPAPPPALLDLLTQYIRQPQPALVVDLGSGTGLSTAVWAGRAAHVIGIEPNADMRQEADRKVEGLPQIEYRAGTAEQTGLPDSCADIVTASQAFHWMEPAATLAEVGRILKPGGLFAAYDYDWPPTTHWELDQLIQENNGRVVSMLRERGLASSLKIYPKKKHLDNMRDSNVFRFIREIFLHHIEYGDAARFLANAQSNAFSGTLSLTDAELGLDQLKAAVHQYIGPEPILWFVSYRVRIGVK